MTGNKGNSTVEAKATQFANLYRQPTGWRLAWLVVSSCEKRQGKRSDLFTGEEVEPKVSMAKFAELAEVSAATVSYYWQAWELAADAGQVPHAKDVPNADDWDDLLVDYGLDEFDLNDETPELHWSFWYQQARNGSKSVVDQKESETKPESNTKSKPAVESKSEVVGEDQDSEVDPEVSLGAGESVQCARNEILEIKESIEAQVNRIRKATTTYGNEAMHNQDVVLALKQLAEVIAELMKEVAGE